MGIGNMKIVYLERNSIGLDISVDCFRQFGDVTEYPYAADAAGTAERIADAAKAADICLSRRQWYDLYKAAGNRLP